MSRPKLFLIGVDMALLWLAIVGFAVATLAVFLLALRPIIPLRKRIWVARRDHGEGLGDKDVWFNHGGDMGEPAIRVPLIFDWSPLIAITL